MRTNFGKPKEILDATWMGLKQTYINLRRGTKDSGLLIYYLDS